MSVTLCCRDATALHTDDGEGALAGMDWLSFAMHLKVCAPCQRYREQLALTVELVKELPSGPPTTRDVDAIMMLLGDAPDPADDP
jgi:hypothetical protein